ncbi:MAG: flagellar hook-basal body complex protein [Pseudomonadota bacterium]
MDNALYYLALNRQVGLAQEMDLVANNIANLDTTGFRREGVAFTEFVVASENGESLSMGDLGARFASDRPGGISLTGGRLDVAIEGPGFFAFQTEDGPVLTRAGAFQTSPEGFLVTPLGDPVLDIGQQPIVIPPNTSDLVIGRDGTISNDGAPIGQLGVFTAPDELINRFGDTAFTVVDDAFEPLVDARVAQGALEESNVDPITEIARMIEVTRGYETAQALIEDEDERIRSALQTLGQTS